MMNPDTYELFKPLDLEFDHKDPMGLMNNNLYTFLKYSHLCDVKICVQNQIFNAHRVVLSASSPYFYAMFSNDVVEKYSEIVELKSVSASIFSSILDFIYTGILPTIPQHNVQELVIAADIFQLKYLISVCQHVLINELDVINAVGMFRLAEAHNFTDLADKAFEFIQKNFVLINVEEFLDLPKKIMLQLLSSEYLCIESETQVMQCAVRWISYKLEERSQYILEVFNNVRLLLLDETTVEQAASTFNDSNIRSTLLSMRRNLFKIKGNIMHPEPRLCAKRDIFVIGGSNKTSHCLETVEKYDTLKECWFRIASMSTARNSPGVTTLRGKVYVTGGIGGLGFHILTTGEYYDGTNDCWYPIQNMILPRVEFGLISLHNYLYAVGGFSFDTHESIERYDPVSNEWQLHGNLPEPRYAMGIASYNDCIYIVGGKTKKCNADATLLRYNPVTQKCEMLATMLSPRCQMGVAVLNDYLYVVGGLNELNFVLRTVEKYSFIEDKWYEVPSMPFGRLHHAVIACNGKLHVIGGEYVDNFPCHTFPCMQFHPKINDWRMGLPPEDEENIKSGAGVVVL